MRMVNEAEAFGGRWAASPLSWLILLLPTTLLVVLQDIETPFPSPAFLLASALLQHIIGGGFAILVVAILRRWMPIIPVGVIFAIWAVAGATRGVVGGVFADYFAGVHADYFFRAGFWIVAALVWMPLFTYLLTQLETRRLSLIELDELTERLNQEKRRAHLSNFQLRGELVSAVRDAVGPLVANVRARLADAAEEDGEIPLGPIGAELESIANEANSIISRQVDASLRVEHPPRAQGWGPILEAMTFDRTRPYFATFLTVAAVAALLLPDSFRLNGVKEILENVGALVSGGLVMVAGLLLSRRRSQLSARRAGLLFALAGFSASGVLLLIEAYPLGPHDIAVAVALPVWFAGSAGILSAEVGVALANMTLIKNLEEIQAELAALREQTHEREEKISAQVAQLLHGPILGRLSACVMALNFFLAEPEHKRGLRRTATTEGVLAHLRLVSNDLEELSGSAG